MSPQVHFVILFKLNITFERFSKTGEYFPEVAQFNLGVKKWVPTFGHNKHGFL